MRFLYDRAQLTKFQVNLTGAWLVIVLLQNRICGFMTGSQLLSCDNDHLLLILQKSLKSMLCQGLYEGVGKCHGSKEISQYNYRS